MSTRNNYPVIKDDSLRNLKQKIQKASSNAVVNQYDNYGYGIPTNKQRMAGPSVNLVNGDQTNNTNTYGPGYTSSSMQDKGGTDKTDIRLANNRHSAVPPTEPYTPTRSPKNGAYSCNNGSSNLTKGTSHTLQSGFPRSAAVDEQTEQTRTSDKSDQIKLNGRHQQIPSADQNSSRSDMNSRVNQLKLTDDVIETQARNQPVIDNNQTAKQFSQQPRAFAGYVQQHQQQPQNQNQTHNDASTHVSNHDKDKLDQPKHSQAQNSERVYCTLEIGLDNLGNTCFMNSILQCLLHILPLTKYFLTADVKSELNLASPKKGALAMSFLQISQEMYRTSEASTTIRSIAPVSFLKTVAFHAPYLMDYQQQDCQEFLRFLLDGMSEDLCRKHSTRDESMVVTQHSPNKIVVPSPSKSLRVSVSMPATPINNRHLTTDNENGEHRDSPHSVCSGSSLVNNRGDSPTEMSMSVNNWTVNTPVGNNSTAANPDTTLAISTSYSFEAFEIDSNPSESPQTSPTPKSGGVKGGLTKLSIECNPHAGHISYNSESTPTTHSTKLRLESTVLSARQDITSPDVKPCVSQQSTPQMEETERDDIGSDRAEISGNIHSTIQVRRSIRLRASKNSYNSPTTGTRKGENGSEDLNPTNDNDKHTPISISKPQTSKSSPLLNSSTKKSVQPQPQPQQQTPTVPLTPHQEAALAWNRYLKLNDSIITDIFAGQLQSTIECLTCSHKSFSYDPFLDLSVPIHRDTDLSSASSGRGVGFLSALKASAVGESKNSTLEKCLSKFTAEEILEGDNMYTCEKCKQKRRMMKKLSIFKYPKVLVIHIKRFRYSSTSREKLSTDVQFPLCGLDLSPYISSDVSLMHNSYGVQPNIRHDNQTSDSERFHSTWPSTDQPSQHGENDSSGHDVNEVNSTRSLPQSQSEQSQQQIPRKHTNIPHQPTTQPLQCPIYDLIAVSNHQGSLHGGHYIAHVDVNNHNVTQNSVNGSNTSSKWLCFNDGRVSTASPNSISGPTAYVLFYKMRNQ